MPQETLWTKNSMRSAMKNKDNKSFQQYKNELNELHDKLMSAIVGQHQTRKEREVKKILKEKESLREEFEKIYGKCAENRKAPIHESHNICEWVSEILAPVGEPRFYMTRKCSKCGAGEAHHAAGHFVDKELYEECRG